jgi:hypothetical protein
MMRFKQRENGWRWEARHGMFGNGSGMKLFETKAQAEADALRKIQGHDSIAETKEFLRRVALKSGRRR